MNKVWAFVSEPKNLAVIMAVAGGLGFVVKEVVSPKAPSPTAVAAAPAPVPAPTQNAFSGSGNAINAAGSSQVQVTNQAAPAAASAAK